MHESQLNIIDKNKKRSIFNKKADQASEVAKLKKSIIQQKQTDVPVSVAVTESVLLEKLEKNEIDYDQYLDLVGDLIDKDPVADDPDAVKGLFSDIRNAETPDALRAIITKAEGMLGSKGKLTLGTFETIERKALAAMTLDDVMQAKAQTRMRFQGKPSVLATQMIMLNALQQYVRQNEEEENPAGGLPQTQGTGTRDENLEELRGG